MCVSVRVSVGVRDSVLLVSRTVSGTFLGSGAGVVRVSTSDEEFLLYRKYCGRLENVHF